MLEDGHVAADLTEAAQGDDAQPSLGQGRGGFQLGVRMTHSLTLPGEWAEVIHCLCDLFSRQGPDTIMGARDRSDYAGGRDRGR
ncbi:hypothetical protein GCM10010398_20030 [Streptomyces fimbriatus]